MTKKLLSSLLIVGIVGSLAAFSVFSAFSDQTINEGNTFSAGTVTLSDNRPTTALYTVTNARPGVVTTGCIQVTYEGTIADAPVKLFTSSTVAPGGTYVDLKITRGAGVDPACADFAADTVAYDSTVLAFATEKNNYANGIDGKAAAASWDTNDAVTYKFEVELQDVAAAQGATTGSHSFIWEARDS